MVHPLDPNPGHAFESGQAFELSEGMHLFVLCLRSSKLYCRHVVFNTLDDYSIPLPKSPTDHKEAERARSVAAQAAEQAAAQQSTMGTSSSMTMTNSSVLADSRSAAGPGAHSPSRHIPDLGNIKQVAWEKMHIRDKLETLLKYKAMWEDELLSQWRKIDEDSLAVAAIAGWKPEEFVFEEKHLAAMQIVDDAQQHATREGVPILLRYISAAMIRELEKKRGYANAVEVVD